MTDFPCCTGPHRKETGMNARGRHDMRLYIAGPMTGLHEYNLAAFADAATRLVEVGHDAVNPGRRGVIPGLTWRDYMRLGLAELLTCDAVAVLPGWETSRGAQLEVHVAQGLAMPVEPLATWLDRSHEVSA